MCPTLCDPMGYSLPGSSVHGIFQARVLEWVAISFSRGSSRPRDRAQVSRTAGRCNTIWATRETPGFCDNFLSKITMFGLCLSFWQGTPLLLFSCSVMSDSLWPHELHHARPLYPTPFPWVFSDSCPSSRGYHPTISSSVIPFSSCLQFFPASGSFPMSQLFKSGGQSIGALASILPINIQCWFPLGLTGLILQSKGLSRIFSNITVWKHQFFGTRPSLWSNFHHPYMTTGKTIALTIQIFVAK